MRLLDFVVMEFISIVERLEEKQDIQNDRIIIDREVFKDLLSKYDYMSFREKTAIYKQLNFIIHDKNNYTMPCKIDKKTTRKVVINYKSYIILKELYELIINNDA